MPPSLCLGVVSWLPHAVIPGLVAFAFFRHIPRKTIVLTLPIVWAIDVDYAVQVLHRAITHSILWPLALLGVVAVLHRRRDATARFWEYATRPGTPATLTMLAYFWCSHLLLDIFQGGVVLFWPLWNRNLFLGFEILLDTGTNTFMPTGEAGSSEGAPELSPLYPWFSYEHSAILAFLAACLVAWIGWRLWQGRAGRPQRPVIIHRTATLAVTIQKE